MKASSPNALARAVRAFFGEYLPELRGLSRHTLLSYRDTFPYLADPWDGYDNPSRQNLPVAG